MQVLVFLFVTCFTGIIWIIPIISLVTMAFAIMTVLLVTGMYVLDSFCLKPKVLFVP